MPLRVAIFVDGDNLKSDLALEIIARGKSYGAIVLARAYGNECTLKNWANCHDFQFIYSGAGKNAADLHLVMEATAYMLTQSVDVVLLCTSDSDFSHIARYFRERDIVTVGCGEAKTSAKFIDACSKFHMIGTGHQTVGNDCADSKVSKLDLDIKAVISAHGKKGAGIRLVELALTMHKLHGIKKSHFSETNWRGYLKKRSNLFTIEPIGQDAKVRYIQSGFSGSEVCQKHAQSCSTPQASSSNISV